VSAVTSTDCSLARNALLDAGDDEPYGCRDDEACAFTPDVARVDDPVSPAGRSCLANRGGGLDGPATGTLRRNMSSSSSSSKKEAMAGVAEEMWVKVQGA
jgi:hypothetical protein